jgi:hypothetical protein
MGMREQEHKFSLYSLFRHGVATLYRFKSVTVWPLAAAACTEAQRPHAIKHRDPEETHG